MTIPASTLFQNEAANLTRSLAENGRGGEASGRFRVRQLIPSAVAQDPGCMVYNEAFKMR